MLKAQLNESGGAEMLGIYNVGPNNVGFQNVG
jgi:hypothetical protein